MRQFHLFILISLCSFNLCCPAQVVKYVNPFIGTGAHGHTYPGATVPFGMVQLSPDTRRGNWDACSGYHYSDSTILGFSHTHLSGTGCIDLGDILFHPTVANLHLKSGGDIYQPLTFSHKNEFAEPGYYRVKLDNGIVAEMTATMHTGVHRYSFPKNSAAKIVVDLNHLLDQENITQASVKQISPNEIAGMRCSNGWVSNQYVYFVAQFSSPLSKVDFVSDGELVVNQQAVNGTHLQVILTMSPSNGEPVMVKVGLSSVSEENARKNLEQEVSDFDFDKVRKNASRQWDKALSSIVVSGSDNDKLSTFYSSLYHTMVVPNTISDANEEYRGVDQKVHKSSGSVYSTFSLWDTFRAWNPLMTLLDTTLVNGMIRSMLNFYDQSGQLPVWPLASGETGCMIGYHAVSVIYDAYNKNIRNYDVQKAFDAMKASADKNNKSTSPFLTLGYIPADLKKESVSCLLENAYDDWCIAQMAKALGKTGDYAEYSRRSMLYKNVFDGNSGFFRGRLKDGNWEEPFDSFEVGRSYTEATAWQYRFCVLHDVKGLINLMGGESQFVQALDTMFKVSSDIAGSLSDITGMVGQYAHGNEPSHHIPYLYNFVGQPWKTQGLTRRLLQEMYQPTPEGISGNEDCGQMSAWYVMSSLGLYQFCPGSGELHLTTPLFGRVIWHLTNGKELIITANNPAQNIYIQKVTFNGKTINANYIRYDDLMKGGHLDFVLGRQPNLKRGIRVADRPYSVSRTDEVSIPYISDNVALFDQRIALHAGCSTPGSTIHYTLDGTVPMETSPIFPDSLVLSQSRPICLKAFKTGYDPSGMLSLMATRAELLPAMTVTSTTPGVRFNYYEGNIQSTHDISTLGIIKDSGIYSVPSIDKAKVEDHFGYIFQGYLQVPVNGIYTFYTKSDDGSVLYIDNQLIVDNDGGHAAISAFGKVALQKGLHPYELKYFEDYEGQSFEWGWKIPGRANFEPVPANRLYTK